MATKELNDFGRRFDFDELDSDDDNELRLKQEHPKQSSPNHRDGVFSTLRNAFAEMFKEGELTDLDVIVQDEIFKCHKVIMAAVSSYFRSLLKSGMQESKDGVVELKDANKRSFELLLRYIYYDTPIVNDETVGDLLQLAVILQIKPLERECVSLMSKNLSPVNCIGVWRAGKIFGCTLLIERAWDILLKHFDEVSRLEEFTSLNKEDLVSILADHSLPVDQEDSICNAVLEWIKEDLTSREQYLEELMTYVCLPRVSGEFLFDRVLNEKELLDRNPKFSSMKDDALAYHLKPDHRISIMAKQTSLREQEDLQKVLVLIGGYYVSDDPLSCMLSLNLKTKRWYTIASMKHEPGEDFAICVHENEVYLSGGARSLDSFWKYNPVGNEWLPQPALLTARECHAMVTVGDSVYIIGGRNSDIEDFNGLVVDIEAYNTRDGQWTTAGKMELPLESMSAVVFKDKIFLFGGLDENRQASSAIQSFDPVTETCKLEGSLPDPIEMSSSVVLNGNIYVVASCGKVFRFDPSDASVMKVAEFEPRSKFGVYVEGQSVVVVGGENDGTNTLSDDVLKIDVRSGKADSDKKKLPIPFAGFKMESLVVPKAMLVQEGFNVMGQNLFDLENEVRLQGKHPYMKKKVSG